MAASTSLRLARRSRGKLSSTTLMHLFTDLRLIGIRVEVRRPSVEVRFHNLHAETEVYIDLSRNLPGMANAIRNGIEVCTQSISVTMPLVKDSLRSRKSYVLMPLQIWPLLACVSGCSTSLAGLVLTSKLQPSFDAVLNSVNSPLAAHLSLCCSCMWCCQ